MKKSIKITGVLGGMALALTLLSTPLFAATDYSALSNEEMAQMRGTMRNADPGDQEAFRTEWQERVNSMSQEERQSAVGRPDNALRDGSGGQYRQGGGNHTGGSSGMGGGAGMGRGRR